MVKKFYNYSVVISALTIALLIYSGLFQIKDKFSYGSLIPIENSHIIKGKILTSPSITTNHRFYKVKFLIYEVEDYNKNKSEAYGKIDVLIPANLVEAYYPGKLYTNIENKNAVIWETGGNYSIEGNYSKNGFLVNDCKSYYFSSDFMGKIQKFRAFCRLEFKRMMFSWGKAGGFLLALLSGSKEYLDIDLVENFKKSGLSHILALSGMHLSLLSGIAAFIGKKIGIKKISYLIQFLGLILFVWFAGFSPSLLRAFICSLLLLIASAISVNQPDMLVILSFSFILQIMIAPDTPKNLAFILSYGALAGILLFNNFFKKIYLKIFPGYFGNSLAASTSAQIITLPVSMNIFGCFYYIGIIATIFVSPLISIFLYSAILMFSLCLIFPFLINPSGIFVNFLYTIIKFLVTIFSKCPEIKI